jgi:hypothetical protein
LLLQIIQSALLSSWDGIGSENLLPYLL